MSKTKISLLVVCLLMVQMLTSCKTPVELPTGVEVLVNGESIEGEKEIEVPRGEEVTLVARGLEGLSTINVRIRKVGIVLFEENFTASAEGIVDESFGLPDMDASATVLVAYTDWSGLSHEDKFTIKLR